MAPFYGWDSGRYFFKKIFMAPFYGCGLTASRLERLRGGSLLFSTNFPEIPGTRFIDLARMSGWVDLGATQSFWTRDPWIGNSNALTTRPLLLKHLFLVRCLLFTLKSAQSHTFFGIWVWLVVFVYVSGFWNFWCTYGFLIFWGGIERDKWHDDNKRKKEQVSSATLRSLVRFTTVFTSKDIGNTCLFDAERTVGIWSCFFPIIILGDFEYVWVEQNDKIFAIIPISNH